MKFTAIMKLLSQILPCLTIVTVCNAQTLTPRVTPTNGGYATDGPGNSMSWTMGQTLNSTFSAGSTLLSQGEQQPELDLITKDVSRLGLCAGDAFTVSYTANGYYGAANSFAAQLSDASGNFALPVNVGSIVAVASGSINCTVPVAITGGTGYKIRVVSSSPAYIGKEYPMSLSIGTTSVAATGASASFTSQCTAGTVNLTASGGTLGSGAQWVWHSGACDGAIIGTGNPLNNVVVSSTTTFYVSAEGGCGHNTACASVTVNVVSCSCSGFKTYGIGAWKANPQPNSAAAYLRDNFAAAFPASAYLTIGCTNKVILTSRNAVRTYLSSNGSPSLLPAGTNTNPPANNNTFASQLVALTLNMGFDNYDANFSASTTHLKDLIVASGTFAGWTVQQVYDEANKKIGGCASIYTPGQLTTVLDQINSNYSGGTLNNGFLNCPSAREENIVAEETASHFTAYPNPVMDRLTVKFSSNEMKNYSLRLIDLSGRIILNEEGKTVNGENMLELNVEALAKGVYILRLESIDIREKLRIVVQ